MSMNKSIYPVIIGEGGPSVKPISGIAEPPRLTDDDEKILDRVAANRKEQRKLGQLKPIPPKPNTQFLPPSKRKKVITSNLPK